MNGRNLSARPGVLENIVYNELVARDYKVFVVKNAEKEVDFVAEKAGKRLYLQVALQLTTQSTVEREFGALRGIGDDYPKYVLTMDKMWGENQNGIEQRFLPDFILEEL